MARITHLNPSGLPSSPAFSRGVAVEGPVRTVYVGGQNAVEPGGTVAGDDIHAQTARALANVELVLADAGARLEDVVTWSIAVVDGQSLPDAFRAFREVWGTRGEPPAISVQLVAALANPAFLVEITAIAAVAAGS